MMRVAENTEDWVSEKPLDFDVISENWNVYELEDKTIIRIKNVLTAIHDAGPAENEKGKKGLRKAFFGMKLLSSVFSPKEIRGEKDSIHPVSELEKNIIQKNLMFRQIKDVGLAEYDTAKSKLRIKTTLRQVDKTSKFDPLGNPSYIIRTDSEVFIQKKLTETEITKVKISNQKG